MGEMRTVFSIGVCRRAMTMFMHLLLVCLVFVNSAPDCSIDRTGLPTDTCAFDLKMRGAQPSRPDQYLCSGYDVEHEITGVAQAPGTNDYIVRFEALANADKAHHILVYGCSNVQQRSTPWSCGSVCSGGKEQILFAWAKNAPALSLPKDVGRPIGANADINYIVIQVHYVHPLSAPDSSGIRLYFTQQRQPYIAGIYLMLAYSVNIPANSDRIHADISCTFNWKTSIYPFGFRTHAHSLGQVISGYKEKNGQYTQIGKGNPQWPQAFYPVKTQVVINPGDNLLARCTYNSTGRNRVTNIGASSKDEMCNFYIMYYMDANDTDKKGNYETCAGNNQRYLFTDTPANFDTPLPKNEALEETATGHHHSHPSGEGEEPNQNEAADQNGDSELIKGVIQEPHKPGNGNSKMAGNIRSRVNGDGILGKDKYGFTYDDGVDLDENYVNNHRVNDVNGFNYPGKGQQYLYDYEPDYQDPDYYTAGRQRLRSKPKKPYYDIDDLRKGYMSDFSKSNFLGKQKQSLSRNRNKLFDNKYDDYASEVSKQSSKLSSGNKGDHSDGKLVKGGNSHSPITEATVPGVATDNKLDLKFISEMNQFEIGQVGGLAVNDAGELHIFHRGSRVWNSVSFDMHNNYQLREYPVETDTLIILNTNGTVKKHFGKNRYFLPHGLSLDKAGNLWLTDVALHQVFRIPVGKEEPDMTLGIKFEPGTDDEHFCKPSDVAVMPSGEFFVSDGYCNSRIMKFDKFGYFVKEWGKPSTRQAGLLPAPGTFNLPHGLTLAEDKKLVCVADRENGRIQCFDYEGNFVVQMHPQSFGNALYALEYCPKHGGILFAVNGPMNGPRDKETRGFTLDINTGNLLSSWNIPNSGLTHPHDLTVDTERHLVYVGELNPSKVWKFEMSKYLLAVNATKGTDALDHSVPVNSDKQAGQEVSTERINVEESESVAPSLIIGTLLVIPVVLLILITILIRLYNTGHFAKCRKQQRGTRYKFNLGNLLNSHKGFDRLSTEDDDHDLENALDDSDNEEFSIVRKA